MTRIINTTVASSLVALVLAASTTMMKTAAAADGIIGDDILRNYSVRFQKCQFIRTYDDELTYMNADSRGFYGNGRGETITSRQRFVTFRLCPTDDGEHDCASCGDENNNYGEYVVDLETYLEFTVRYFRSEQEKFCDACADACPNNGFEDDNEMGDENVAEELAAVTKEARAKKANEEGCSLKQQQQQQQQQNTKQQQQLPPIVVDCNTCNEECQKIENMEENGYVDATLFLECQMIYDPEDDDLGALYAGPVCAGFGERIEIGVFTDEDCTVPDDTKNVDDYLMDGDGNQMKLSNALLKQTYSTENCIDCKPDSDDTAVGISSSDRVCGDLYGRAAKCERTNGVEIMTDDDTTRFRYHNQLAQEDQVCDFIRALNDGTYIDAPLLLQRRQPNPQEGHRAVQHQLPSDRGGLRHRRWLEDNNNGSGPIPTRWLRDYSIRFEGCQHFPRWNREAYSTEDVRLATKRLVHYQLCPTTTDSSMCSSAGQCGEYIVDLSEYMLHMEEFGRDPYNEWGECNELEYNGEENEDAQQQRLYVGPYCSALGMQVRWGIFTDNTCTIFASEEEEASALANNAAVFDHAPITREDPCLPCGERGQESSNNNNMVGSSVCDNLYLSSGKCETDLFPSTTEEVSFTAGNNACNYIENNKINTAGTTVLTATNLEEEPSDPSSVSTTEEPLLPTARDPIITDAAAIRNYSSLWFQKCQSNQTHGDDDDTLAGGAEKKTNTRAKQTVTFWLCPVGAGETCESCESNNYEEYVVDLETYLRFTVEYLQFQQEKRCNACEETCLNIFEHGNEGLDDEDGFTNDDASGNNGLAGEEEQPVAVPIVVEARAKQAKEASSSSSSSKQQQEQHTTTRQQQPPPIDVDCDTCYDVCQKIETMEENGYIDATNFLECQMIYDPEDDGLGALYAGPVCSGSGQKIKIGVFEDGYCRPEHLTNKRAEDYLLDGDGYRMKLSHALLKQTYSTEHCVRCKSDYSDESSSSGTVLGGEEEENNAVDGDDNTPECQTLHETAEKNNVEIIVTSQQPDDYIVVNPSPSSSSASIATSKTDFFLSTLATTILVLADAVWH